MVEQNRPPSNADKAYSMAAMIGVTIDRIQKVVKAQMSTIMRVDNEYPKFLVMKWIPEGIEVAFGFTDEGISCNVFTPEDIQDYPTEYQEKIAEVKQELVTLGFTQTKGDNK